MQEIMEQLYAIQLCVKLLKKYEMLNKAYGGELMSQASSIDGLTDF